MQSSVIRVAIAVPRRSSTFAEEFRAARTVKARRFGRFLQSASTTGLDRSPGVESRAPMLSRPVRFWSLLGLTSLLACQPQIGDDCKTSINCSQSGDRLCDRTQPEGYCTIYNCTPGSCPDNSVCVGFAASLSVAPECSNDTQVSRFQRTFCMAECDANSDCRSSYACVDLSGGIHNTRLIDTDRKKKACMVANFLSSPTEPDLEGRATDVCEPPTSLNPSFGGSPSSGGRSASGGALGTGGTSGNAGGAGGSTSDGSGGAQDAGAGGSN